MNIFRLFIAFFATLVPAVGARADYALVVGINSYPHLSSGSSLEGSVGDAKAMKSVLHRFGFPDDHIFLLIDADATHEGMMNALERIKKLCGRKDRFVLYFAGHGSRTTDGKSTVLLPHDAIEDSLINTVTREELSRAVHAIPARARTVLIDACFAEGISTRGLKKPKRTRYHQVVPMVNGEGSKQRVLKVDAVNYTDNNQHVTNDDTICCFVAAKRNQAAGEQTFENGTHGIFTYALLKRLSNCNPAASWASVQSEVCGEVTKLMDQQQTPIFSTNEFQSARIFDGIAGGPPAPSPQDTSLWSLYSETRPDSDYLSLTVSPDRTSFVKGEKFDITVTVGLKVGEKGAYLLLMDQDAKGVYLFGPDINNGDGFEAAFVKAGVSRTFTVHGVDVGFEKVKALLIRSKEQAKELFDRFPKAADGKNRPSGASQEDLQSAHARELKLDNVTENPSAGAWNYYSRSLELHVVEKETAGASHN